MRSVRGMRIVSILAVGGLRRALPRVVTLRKAAAAPATAAPRPPPAPIRPAWSPTSAASTTSRSTPRRGRACRRPRPTSDKLAETKNVLVQGRGRLRAEPDAVRQPELQLHPRGRRPDGRRDQEDRGGQPEPAVRDRRRDDRRARPTSTRCSSTPRRPAFLAGYLAAGYSKTGKVGTYGGIKIPPVTIFMDGFADGVAYYNQVKEQERPGARLGQGHAERPVRQRLHRPGQGQDSSSDTLVAQGADVIMPVAGGTGPRHRGRRGRRQVRGHLGRRRRLRERAAVLRGHSSPPS